MIPTAFATPLTLQLHTRRPSLSHNNRIRFASPKHLLFVNATSWRASGSNQPDRNSNAPDDATLNSELQAKVKELFGSRSNVTIDIERDSGVQFIVRRGPGSTDFEQTKAAWTLIISIGVLSVVAGVLFTGLYFTGAVHGSTVSERRYEMPSYGSNSYINPYQLLDEDRQLQDSRAQ